MVTKHTPAPWHINNNFGTLQIISETEAVIARLLNSDDEVGFEIAEANAKLITTAPDLLEALQKLLDANSTGSLFIISEAVSKAKDVIAKATQ